MLEFIREHEAETLVWSSVGDIWFVKTYFKQFLTYHKQQFLVMETLSMAEDGKEEVAVVQYPIGFDFIRRCNSFFQTIIRTNLEP